MAELRAGEVLLENCDGGKCIVCKQLIPPGKAVQLSKWTNSIRHLDCMPIKDTGMGVVYLADDLKLKRQAKGRYG